MQICQNPNCRNPFNPDNNKFCQYCGQNNLNPLLRNRFRVNQLIGEGAFGRTYAAEDIDRLDDPCVIKQFFPQVSGTAALNKATELFKQEAKRLYELGEHPQIPRLISYFEQGNCLYLVQEFIQGKTLWEELQQQAFNEIQIRQVLADLLPVLQFVHERQVIHRDIKPENIIRRQNDRKFVLIDFGGAKLVTQTNLAKAATGIYTLGYAPHEQMAGKPSAASDLYSLGATCVRLLTQCLPVPDEYGDMEDELYDAMEGRWLWQEYLQQKGVKINQELAEVLDKLLAYLPKNRFQSAAEVLEALSSPPLSQSKSSGAKILPSPILKKRSGVKASPSPTLAQAASAKVAEIQKLVSPILPQRSGVKASRFSTLAQAASAKVAEIQKLVSPILPQRSGVKASRFSTLAEAVSEKVAKIQKLGSFDFDMVTVDEQGKITTKERLQAQFLKEDLGNGIILEMVYIPGGTFLMGSPNGQGDDDERPQHQVTVAPFLMGKYPVTQAQWKAVAALPQIGISLNSDPSSFKGATRPVENVSWHEALEFCARLSKKTGHYYRLPSEAEWEYGCRAGTTTPFHFGETITPDLANYDGNDNYGSGPIGKYRQETTPVGSFKVANAFGLYDMHGNVWQWCADPWHSNYQGAPGDGKVWRLGGDDNMRLLRGGSWISSPWLCRSTNRLKIESDGRYGCCGFRVVALASAWTH